MLHEKAALGGEVRVHASVEVEMVPRQIHEHGHLEEAAAHALEHERVRRNLHHDMSVSRIAHVPHQRLEIRGFGRRARGFHHAIAEPVLHRAEETRRTIRRLQSRLDEKARRGFAVGTRDADKRHGIRGPIEQQGRDLRQSDARVGHSYPGASGKRRLFGNDDDRSAPARVVDKTIAVL
jgi:hypothetical protein